MSDAPNQAPSPLAAAIEGAPVVAEAAADIQPDEPKRRRGGPGLGLPEGCPVQALGIDGSDLVLLSASGQLIRQAAGKMTSSAVIEVLFAGHYDELAGMWPKLKWDKESGAWEPTGDPHYAQARRALIDACAYRGIWGGHDRMRGVGTWRGDDDELILHQGDRIFVSAAPHAPDDSPRIERPGLIGKHVYPAGPEQPRQAGAAGVPGAAAQELLDLFGRWNWRRGDIDARLLLGWVGCAILGGALDWRPHIWLTGPTGNGKSTLQDDVLRVVLDDAVIGDQDTTAAAVRAQLGTGCLPIMLDEKDPGGNDSRLQEMIRVIRVAASGGRASRSSAGHEQHQTRIASAALLASSLVPPLEPEDRNRLAILELLPLAPGGTVPAIDKRRLRQLGAELRLQLLLGWPQWRQRVTWWREAMQSRDHNGRGAAVYGTLLAAADMLTAQLLPESLAAVEPLLDELSAEAISDQRGDVSDQQLCLDRLLQARIEWSKSSPRGSIGQLALDVVGDPGDDARHRALKEHGVMIERRKNGGGAWLLVANRHSMLDEVVFRNTKWSGGVWRQSLERLEGAEVAGNRRMGAVSPRCLALPIDRHLLCPAPLEGEQVSRAGEADDVGF